MLTAQQNNDGLGVFVVGTGKQTRFFTAAEMQDSTR
jgi:hypothetical protein